MFTNRQLKRTLIVLFVFLLILGGCKTQSARDVSAKSIKRIISLSPHITEILYALGQQNKLVGVTDYCQFPPQAKQKEHIGGFLNPNLEKIISLRPDLLIGVPSNAELAHKLAGEHFKAVLLPNDQLNDLFFTIDSLGRLLHCPTKAKQLVKTIQDSLDYYRQKAKLLSRRHLTAMLVIGRDPGSTTHLTVVGPHTFIDSIWTLVGGKNVFNDLPARYAQVNRENVLLKQPRIIIEFKFNEQWNARKDALNKKEWQSLEQIPAVKFGNIYVLTGNYTLIPGPRVYKLAGDYYHILQTWASQKKGQRSNIL